MQSSSQPLCVHHEESGSRTIAQDRHLTLHRRSKIIFSYKYTVPVITALPTSPEVYRKRAKARRLAALKDSRSTPTAGGSVF